MMNLDKLKWIPKMRRIIDIVHSKLTAIIGYQRKTWVLVKKGKAGGKKKKRENRKRKELEIKKWTESWEDKKNEIKWCQVKIRKEKESKMWKRS
jgi:hypothetical protein